MILDENDKRFLNIIQAISRLDQTIILEVFRSTLQAAVKEIYAGTNELTIPGVCSLKISYYDQVKNAKGMTLHVDLEAEPKRALVAEISSILEGNETPDLRKIKEEIKDKFKLTVDVE